MIISIGCSEQENSSETTSEVEIDPVLNIIEEGRNTKLSISERQAYLNKAYERIKLVSNDSLKTKYFSRLSLAYSKIDDSLLFRQTNKETISLGNKIGDSITIAEAHWDLALFFSNAFIKDSAYYHYGKAQKLYSQLRVNYESGIMLYNMAKIQADVKDYTGSEATTFKAIELFKPLDKYLLLYRCYNNLGIISNNLGEYNNALKYHQTALTYNDKLENKYESLPQTLNNIGVVYQEQKNYNKAITYFQNALKIDSLFNKDSELYVKVLNNLGHSKFQLGDTTEVKQLFLEASRISDNNKEDRGFALSNYNLAEYFLAKQDTLTAINYANIANKVAKKSSNNKRHLLTLELFTRLIPKNASTYTHSYISLNDSLQLADRRTRNKFTRIEFETNEVKEKNALLAKQQQLWIGISIGLFVLALFIVLSIYQRIRNQKLRFEQQQQASNQEIFDLMLNQKEQIEESKQAEQKRISEELHDGIVGQMAGIRLMFIGLNKRKDEESVERREGLIKKLQETEEEIRTISHELNHASYQKIHNFINSIQELLDSTGSVAGIENNFYYNQEVDWDDISSEIKVNLYRIVQESLQNCVKYAEASNILLDFDTNEKGLKIVISDNGVGFDTKKGKKGIGLKNIQSRVKKLHGTWEISSKLGEGTTTIIEIPRNLEELPSAYPLKKVL
ncbi:tetratricopeptide repeat-containing sensor histidine kinase [Spongiimicrobium salis]|uniref:tetratricopeptide repeat-containing sensor histidine kinase n=1 Tax=Spongiimicrobium salis TaxID=1667022 RepID=UPI00374D27C1